MKHREASLRQLSFLIE